MEYTRFTEESSSEHLLFVQQIGDWIRVFCQRRGEQNTLEMFANFGEKLVNVRSFQYINLMLDTINLDGNHEIWILHRLKVDRISDELIETSDV